MSRILNQLILSTCVLVSLVSIARPAIAQTPTTAVEAGKTQATPPSISNVKATDDDDDHDSVPVEIVVPLATFIFVAVVILGPRYMREKSARHRIDALRLMMEKGQPIPEEILKQMLVIEEPKRSIDPKAQHMKQLRNGLALTGAGIALVAYRLLTPEANHKDVLILGLLGVGIGAALLIAYKISDKHMNP